MAERRRMKAGPESAAPSDLISPIHPRREQICNADTAEHFGADAIGDAVDDFRAVLRGIDMGTEWPLAEGHADHPDDRFGDSPCIAIGGFERGETLQRLIRQAG
jgi:hypothetical protein